MPNVISSSRLSDQVDRVMVLLNPKAGSKASQPRATQLVEELRSRGYSAEIHTDLGAATTAANEWHSQGRLRALVGVGGDGTAAELVNRTADGLPIALLPAGTSNLLARYMQMPADPKALCQTIAEGMTVRLDAGLANDRIFLLMASCGLDAEVVRRVHTHRTGHISHLSYVLPLAKTVATYRFPVIHVKWLSGNVVVGQLSTHWLFTFNMPCYGGGFRIEPQADAADGLLDLCGYTKAGFWNGLICVTAVLLRQHKRLATWFTRRVTKLRIEAEGEVPYQLDGDIGGVLPLDIEILPGRLTLLVPALTTHA